MDQVKLQLAIAYIRLVMLVFNYQCTVFIRRQQLTITILQLLMQLCVAAKYYKERPTRKRKRSAWIVPRQQLWWDDVSRMDNDTWKNNFRVNKETFNVIVRCLSKTHFSRRDTQIRKCIPIDKRVAIALYTLTTTAEYCKIAEIVGVGKSTVCTILHDFCEHVIAQLKKRYLNFPQDETATADAIVGFQRLGFPQCIGSVDGCHIPASPPKEMAWQYYNSEGWHSMILLAVVDSHYCFRFVSVDSPGSNNDAYIFKQSKIPQLMEKLHQRQLMQMIKGTPVPPLLLSDTTFPSHPQVIKPYPDVSLTKDERKYFNYKHARVMKIAKYAFTRLKSRFKRISKRVECNIGSLSRIVIACCILHNLCQDVEDTFDPKWITETEEVLQPCQNSGLYETDRQSNKIRDVIGAWLADGKAVVMHRDVGDFDE